MKESMLDKVTAESWKGEYEDAESLIAEACWNYDQLGQLITELLIVNGGSGDYEDRIVKVAAELFENYLGEYAPQPGSDIEW